MCSNGIDHAEHASLSHTYMTYTGPFVMNTREQITEAIMDYSQGRNGFERAQKWQSEIGKSALR